MEGTGLVFVAIAMLVVNAIGIFGEPSAALYVTSLILTLAVATTNFITIALRRLLYGNKD